MTTPRGAGEGRGPAGDGTADDAAGSATRPMRIGLTGPIGCGKSTVTKWLVGAGGTAIDADAIAREVTAPGEPAVAAIAERFGPGVLAPDGALDRAALAAIVFADADALRDLEAIVHPAVRARIQVAFAAAERAGEPFVVVEAIRLVEGGLAAACDEVWLVACGPTAQRDRLAGRGMTREDAERRIAAQGADLVVRLSPRATRRIDTDGPPDAARVRVLAALREALADRA